VFRCLLLHQLFGTLVDYTLCLIVSFNSWCCLAFQYEIIPLSSKVKTVRLWLCLPVCQLYIQCLTLFFSVSIINYVWLLSFLCFALIQHYAIPVQLPKVCSFRKPKSTYILSLFHFRVWWKYLSQFLYVQFYYLIRVYVFWVQNDMEVSHRYVSRGIHTKSSSGNSLQNSFNKPSKANHALKRSTSQKDFFHSRDSSSVSTFWLLYIFWTEFG